MTEAPRVSGQRSRHRLWWGVWLTMVVLGLAVLVAAGGLMAQARVQPVRIGPMSAAAVPLMLVGAAAVCVGSNGLLLGLGMNRRLLSPGSHRGVILATMLALGVAALVFGTYVMVQPGALRNMDQAFVVAGVGLYGALALMTYLHGVRSGLLNLRTLGLAPLQVTKGVGWGLAGALAVLGVAAANGVVLQALGLQHPQAEAFRWLEGREAVDYMVTGLAVAVVAPAVEELFFRGYVFNAYLAEKGQGTAYVGSAVLFGLVHGLPTLFLGIFGMGLVLAFIYRRAGTIVAPIVAHGLNNGLALAALLTVTHS